MDLLEHLDEIKELEDPMRPLKPLIRDIRYPSTAPGTSCIACGYLFEYDWDGSHNHHIGRRRSDGYPMCTGMELTRNHCIYQLRSIAIPGYGIEACHCGPGEKKHKPHDAERLIDHYLPRARERWNLRLDALHAQLADEMQRLGIDDPAVVEAITGEAA